MNVEYQYTKHHVARGARADAERNDALVLLKNVSSLRLTYQIRLLAYRALQSGRQLFIRVPGQCKVHSTLRDFQKEHSKLLRIERV